MPLPYPDILETKLLWSYRTDENGCWIWTGPRSDLNYGRMEVTLPDGSRLRRYAHRVSYEIFRGPIPERPRHEIHHVCGNPPCINPAHLECLTRREHASFNRRDACCRGHARTPENTYVAPAGGRFCRICAAERARNSRAEKGLKGGPGAHNRAKTHCLHGHPYDEANTVYIGRKRRCRICTRDAHRRYRQRLLSL